ncbi:MAG: hypothetical protein EAZ85_05990 [Bacteroidetes bacterium]|nr:MAG: hypothetical protein EAZ85_05990 [Bacteroidota bacterium]TAG92781.1 MAG: hypothetical protein EAZ20_02225 [Bacteroidota bacterium]
MMYSKLLFIFCLFFGSLFLYNCGGSPKAEVKISLKNLLFEGKEADFGTASIRTIIKINIDSILKANKATKISKAKLSDLSLRVKGSENFDLLSNITLQFLEKDTKSMSIANASKIASKTAKLSPTMSEKADAKDFFQKGTFEALIDLNLKDETSEEKVSILADFDCTLFLQ